jgi:FKBP-type peptidyl-prolyl cis-trans isomerase SlyD
MDSIAITHVKNDLVVSLDYELEVDGEVIDSSSSKPLELLQGHRNIIPGLERELEGMAVGETRKVIIAPADGYGEFDPEAFTTLERSMFPADFPLELDRSIRLRADNGQIFAARICDIADTEVKLDMNHPLAGKELHFTATIAGLREATEDELASGRVGGCSSCGSGGCSSGSCSC